MERIKKKGLKCQKKKEERECKRTVYVWCDKLLCNITYPWCIYSTCNLLSSTVCVPHREVTSPEIFLVSRYLITVGLSNRVTFQGPSFSSLFLCLPQVSARRFIFICIILYARFISICCENKPYFFWLHVEGFLFLVQSEGWESYFRTSDTFHFISTSVCRFCL